MLCKCQFSDLYFLEDTLRLPPNPHIHKAQQQIIEENIFMLQDLPNCPKVS